MTEVADLPQKQQKSKPAFDPVKHWRSNGEIAFQPGTNYLFEGRVVELKQMSDDECVVWDAAEAREIPCRAGELDLPKQKPIVGTRRPENMTRGEFKTAQRLRSAMVLYYGLPRGERTTEKLDALAQTFSLSSRQLRRRFDAWDGRLDSLLPGLPGPHKGYKMLNKEVEDIIAQCIKLRRECKEEWTLDDLVEDIETVCENAKPALDAPCKRTVADRLARQGYSLRRHRLHGHRKADEKESPKLKTYNPGLPLAQVQIDHTRIDLMVYDSEERVGLRRPWLTVVFDSASRVILGYHLSFDAPSVESVVCALLMAMLPKHKLLKEHGIGDGLTWDVWGKAKGILTDWAQEFRSKDFRTVCANAGIKTELRKFAQKHWGGRIERVIGTMMGKMHMLPGTTFSNPRARDGYDSEAKAIMDLGDVRGWLINQIIEYHNTPHSGLKGRTPMQMWKHLLTTKEGDYIPPPLMDPEYYKQLEYDLLPSANKQIHSDYVIWNNRPYQNGVFSLFKDGTKVDIKYHPNRLRTILYRDQSRVIHEIKTSQPPSRNITLSEEKAIAGAIRLDGATDGISISQRKQARANKKQIVKDAEEKTRKAKQVARRTPNPAPAQSDDAEGEFFVPNNVIWN